MPSPSGTRVMTTALPPVTLNRDAHIEMWKIGHEEQPVFIVDDALVEPEALVEFAQASGFVSPAEGSYYPGLNALLPANYLPTILAALQRPMIELYDMGAYMPPPAFGFFGLATLPPETMAVRQALPHTDTHRANSLACVHFLGGVQFGGTAFYRHKATGFEVLTPIRSHPFTQTRTKELAEREGQPPAALHDLYEETAYIESKFNRLILYRAASLHSAKLENTTGLSNDPRTGRLTANLFINT